MADTSKIVTGSSLAYFKQQQDIFNAGKFVAKEEGKGLSTNDYTTAEKNKLAAVEAGAQVNVIEKIKMNDEELVIENKTVDLGTIATSEELEALEGRVEAVEEDIDDLYADYPVTITSASGSGDVLKTYTFTQAGSTIGTIDIPKDFLVKSASVKKCVKDDEPVEGLKVGDPYIDFVINTKEGSGTDEHIYVPCKDFVDVYTEGNGIDITKLAVLSLWHGHMENLRCKSGERKERERAP